MAAPNAIMLRTCMYGVTNNIINIEWVLDNNNHYSESNGSNILFGPMDT